MFPELCAKLPPETVKFLPMEKVPLVEVKLPPESVKPPVESVMLLSPPTKVPAACEKAVFEFVELKVIVTPAFWVIVPEYPEFILIAVILILLSIVAAFVEVLSKIAVSAAAGMLLVDQFSPQDHLFPSPAFPPQLPSLPPPSQVTFAA